MTRSWFGGDSGSFVVTLYTLGSRKLMAVEQDPVEVWSDFAASGGQRLTDLLDKFGVPTAAPTVTPNGQVEAFQGPDGVNDRVLVTADHGGSGVWLLNTDGLPAADARVAAEAARDDARAAAADAADAAASVPISGTPTDGQILAYSSTLGGYAPVAPAGTVELAYAENATGAGTAVSSTGGQGARAPIANTTTVVPISTRPVWLDYGIVFVQTGTAQPGSLYLYVMSGATTVCSYYLPLPNSVSSDQYARIVQGRWRLGPVAAPLTLNLAASVVTASGVSASASVLNGAVSVGNKSFLAASAR